jgi:hypothetical protein
MRNATRKPADPTPSDNDEPAPGDAREPERLDEATFDPAELERQQAAPAEKAPDPFDPENLRIKPAGPLATPSALTVVDRKPHQSWFVQVNPDPRYQMVVGTIELKDDREQERYLLTPDVGKVVKEVEKSYAEQYLLTAINAQGVLFLWPIRTLTGNSKADKWNQSALEAASLATKKWVRVMADMTVGGYVTREALGQLPDPKWPETPFGELLRLAFRDRLVTSLNHPILRRLRGESS